MTRGTFIGQILIRIFFVLTIVFGVFFIGGSHEAENISWGVNFSQKQSQNLGLDWKKNYSALLEGLGAKNIKIAAHWDLIEPEKDSYFFEDLDWQLEEAGYKQAKVILVIGMKTSRWPECHIPPWAVSLKKEEQQKEILKMLEKIVLKYKFSPNLLYWQVENEPFFPFGECPWQDADFLKKEVELVKSLDDKHPIIVSESGEFRFWTKPAKVADIVGITLYREAWFKELDMRIDYPLPPIFYWRRLQIIELLFKKKVICVELQAEPWGPVLLYDLPPNAQKLLMPLEKLKSNIGFAKKTGVDTFYLWGSEWWYYLKEKEGDFSYWNEIKKLFSQ